MTRPGLSNALAGLAATNPTVARASNFSTVTVSPQNAFALDSACLQRCGLPATGAPGNGLSGLSQELQVRTIMTDTIQLYLMLSSAARFCLWKGIMKNLCNPAFLVLCLCWQNLISLGCLWFLVWFGWKFQAIMQPPVRWVQDLCHLPNYLPRFHHLSYLLISAGYLGKGT